jgi:hypothetical protein
MMVRRLIGQFISWGGGFPRLWYEDNLSDIPLCREVPFEQDCIEQLCNILYSNSRQFFEDFAGDDVLPS